MTQINTQVPLETWLSATWDEFITLADDAISTRVKGYYYQSRMRFEPMSTGSDHSKDHTLILFAVSCFAAQNQILVTGHDGCSYRKPGFTEFQPDISYYIGANAEVIPWGTRVVDLNLYPCPDVVIEISDTSLSDDQGTKRLQYEDLRIPEYWIVDVKIPNILAFSVSPDGSSRRIRQSLRLPGLELNILEVALQRSRRENQSLTMAWLMTQFQN